MLLNAEIAISTSTVLLVPYSRWHVPRYHEWMKDEEIQEATASEPLSLEEEYAMQQSWRQDPDKLTFIVCQPSPTGTPLHDEDDSSERMIGDVNLFLRVDDGEEGDSEPQIVGEIELMIAEKCNQRKGLGKATLVSFLRYIADHEGEILEEFIRGDQAAAKALRETDVSGWRFSYLSVKIGQGNARSLGLFEGAGFRKVSEEANYFGEFELRRMDLGQNSMDQGLDGYVEMEYTRGQ
ncbi:GNAT domain-containing protein [Aspergillus bertholletiae]|uniref:GNAT domain-containing protein n=1 Tax=Aspergillus bertholletiae TaxID=1226010 RepID=A0A5N7BML6_9EURO|nr:GNAT domain-containing protein [Aspergillus bertholletiae]